MSPLRVRGFAPLLAGQAVSAVGNWVAIVAIWGFAAFRFDAGPADLGLLFLVLSVPGALLGPLLGVPIDRLGPRRALVLANLLGFVVALALTQAGSYHAVIALALPLGLVEPLASASLAALPPRLVDDEHLVAANALLGAADDVALVAGPMLALAVNARWGLSGAFLADALTFLVGLAVAIPLDDGHAARRPGPEPEPVSTWRFVREGIGLARSTPVVRWTLSVAAATYSLWAVFGILEPLYVRDVLGRSDSAFAALQAVFGLGLVGAGLVLARVGDRIARPRWVATATVVSGATAGLYLATRSLAVAVVGVFLWGVDVAFFHVPAKTLLQRAAPLHAHGRVLALSHTLEAWASMLVAPVVALAVGTVGVQRMGVAGGVLVAVAGLVALGAARRLEPVPPAEPAWADVTGAVAPSR